MKSTGHRGMLLVGDWLSSEAGPVAYVHADGGNNCDLRVDVAGRSLDVEVKSTKGKHPRFILTKGQCEHIRTYPDNWLMYAVTRAHWTKRYKIHGPYSSAEVLAAAGGAGHDCRAYPSGRLPDRSPAGPPQVWRQRRSA